LGGAKRVSKNAASEIAKVVEEHAKVIIEKALRSALMDGRKTLRKEDVGS